MKQNKNILKENLVESTIHIINRLVRMATNQSKKDRCETDYYCMTGNLVEEVINSYQNKAARTALVIDDIGTQVINRLYQEGLRQITLCLARFNNVKTETVDQVKRIITSAFPDIKLNIILIGELKKEMEFDLIIANPPYGAIGANIVDKVINTVKYKEFVCLLPANDYKRNTEKDLFKYARNMRPACQGEKAFDDAAVTTHIANIVTEPNEMTLDEFERSNYIDRSLDKYFAENSKRVTDVIDKYLPSRQVVIDHVLDSLIFTKRDVNHKHLPYSKNVNSYKWNVEHSITAEYLINNTAVDFNNTVSVEMLIYKSEVERLNAANLYYSNNGFKFLSKLFAAVNVDSRIELNKVFPKVDWTRAWTVEEILADYGYTEDEIKEVMDDLINYKSMD